MTDPLAQLLELSRDLGQPWRELAILGEGNTSCRVDDETFLVKASGSSLRTLAEADITRCRLAPLLELMNREDEGETDEEVACTLLACRVEESARKPSTETAFHAWLLTLPGVEFVAHTHPVSVNGILCSPRAQVFAKMRMFPDEIVCCGRQSVLVPYTDPGVPLARRIRREVIAFQEKHGCVPRTVLLENHGLIALGRTPAAALATTLMCDKAAKIFSAASALGGPQFLPSDEVQRIDGREDEAYRQRALGLE